VAPVGNLWVVSLSKPCGRLLGARCRMTGDAGDPALADAPVTAAPDAAAGWRDAALRARTLRFAARRR
jgi:hypothetical protein